MKLSDIFKKPLKLTNNDRISVAQERVAAAFDMFVKADNELTSANAELVEVILAEQARIETAKTTLERAEYEMIANNALKSRLTDFIPK